MPDAAAAYFQLGWPKVPGVVPRLDVAYIFPMVTFGTELDRLLRELEMEGERNDAVQTDRSKKFLNLERPTAELVYVLLRASRRRHVLEIGTSNGYSTIWLTAALKNCADAMLISIDASAEKLALARKNLARAGFDRRVELKQGRATEVVAGLEGPFDCIFFDADRVSAPEQVRLLLPKLNDDVLLLADNVISHPEEIAGYRATVEQLPGFVWTVTPVGKGLHIAWRSQPKAAEASRLAFGDNRE